MNHYRILLQWILTVLLLAGFSSASVKHQRITAVGIPLADHYAGIVAYENWAA